MENISTYNNADQQDDEMQLIPLIKLCYHQFITYWGWFALSTVVCVCLGWLYQQKQSRIFQRQAVMLIEDTNGGSSSSGFRSTSRRNSGMNTLLELNGVSVFHQSASCSALLISYILKLTIRSKKIYTTLLFMVRTFPSKCSFKRILKGKGCSILPL